MLNRQELKNKQIVKRKESMQGKVGNVANVEMENPHSLSNSLIVEPQVRPNDDFEDVVDLKRRDSRVSLRKKSQPKNKDDEMVSINTEKFLMSYFIESDIKLSKPMKIKPSERRKFIIGVIS